jgi:hypothetical protein
MVIASIGDRIAEIARISMSAGPKRLCTPTLDRAVSSSRHGMVLDRSVAPGRTRRIVSTGTRSDDTRPVSPSDLDRDGQLVRLARGARSGDPVFQTGELGRSGHGVYVYIDGLRGVGDGRV